VNGRNCPSYYSGDAHGQGDHQLLVKYLIRSIVVLVRESFVQTTFSLMLYHKCINLIRLVYKFSAKLCASMMRHDLELWRLLWYDTQPGSDLGSGDVLHLPLVQVFSPGRKPLVFPGGEPGLRDRD